MKKSIILMFFLNLIIFNQVIYAQKKNQNRKFKTVRINQSKPSVYIVAESDEKLNKMAETNERILLRLYNNSRWGIWLHASGAYAEFEDGAMYYEVFVKDVLKYKELCHVCSFIVLPSGKSFLFSVPKQFLTKDSSMRIQFDYNWEDNYTFEPNEPVHYVQFFSRDLSTKD